MRETKFIEQNKEKWSEFERILDSESRQENPNRLNELFVQITDDLSYSRTFYPNRSVRVYLNSLAQRIFFRIYKNRKTRLGRLLQFWTDELPLLMYDNRRPFLLSFLFFLSAYLIGFFSSAMDPEFPRVMLGDSYVDMTLENIEKGDPMAVYKEQGQLGMSLGITLNNIYVAFLTYALGAFFCLGTIGILVKNAAAIGAFQHFFFERGLFQESSLTLWMHGTLEIAAIIIAGAAGLVLGSGLVFPGTYSRMRAFQMSARRSLKILLGTVPIFILAGFIEGFVTRYTDMPDLLRLFFILLCLAFILFYFVWYPRRLASIGGREYEQDRPLPPDRMQEAPLLEVHTVGATFTHIFIYINKQLGPLLKTALAGAILFCLYIFLFAERPYNEQLAMPYGLFSSLELLGQFFDNPGLPYEPIVHTLGVGLMMVGVFHLFIYGRLKPKEMSWGRLLGNYVVRALPPALILSLMLHINDWYVYLVFLPGFLPIIFLWAFVMFQEESDPFTALGRALQLASANLGRLWGLALLNLSISVLLFLILDTFIWGFYTEMIGWNVTAEGDSLEKVVALLYALGSIFWSYALLSLFLLGAALQYFTFVEIQEAAGLSQKLEGFGEHYDIQGMAKERGG